MTLRHLFFATLSGAALLVSAQAPQRMTFQAVLRDASDNLVVSGAVGLRASVLQGSASGTAVYVETHSTSTNANGLATLEIGGGTPVTGTFSGINWGNGPFFLKTETDPNGGSNYSITGVSPLLSVPYALFAANNSVGPAGPQGPQGPVGPQGPGACEIHTGDGRAVLWNSNTAYGFGFNETSGSNWYVQSLNGPVVAALASDSNVVLYTATTAYGFGKNSTSGSGWYVQTLNEEVLGAVTSNARIVLYTANTAFGFGYDDISGSDWYVQSINAPVSGEVVAGNRIVLYTASSAYGFGYDDVSGSDWYVQSLNTPVIGVESTR
jgi:hypothetical protein